MQVEVLRRVRAIQAAHGHAKHTLVDDQGRVCLYGALNLAYGAYGSGYIVGDIAAYEFARDLGFKSVQEAVRWNNASNNTLDYVLARLDAAIAQKERLDPLTAAWEPVEPEVRSDDTTDAPPVLTAA